jgi:hypothetical protein
MSRDRLAAAPSHLTARLLPREGAGGRPVPGEDALAVPAVAPARKARSGEDCPTGALCGQDAGACGSTQWYFYSDMLFCNPPPTTCQRVRCENFPPPGVTISQPIGVITWRGVYIDDGSNFCTKPEHLFRIQFYEDEDGAPKNPGSPYYSEYLIATGQDLGILVSFCEACTPTPLLEFTAVLTIPVNLTAGWFSITGYGTPGCYHLWEGSDEGDNKFYGWWEEGGTVPGPAVTTFCDLNYCFLPVVYGACCVDCAGYAGWCVDNVTEQYCSAMGGRFAAGTACAQLSPPCGHALGACCHDDGTCELVTCCQCAVDCGSGGGDLNCDGTIDFGDINPFVLYLSNFAAWQVAYPGCNPIQGDINCDGTWGQGSFTDINPFVQLMVLCGGGCPWPGPGCLGVPRAQGIYWAGPNTSCPTDCCTVVVPPGALRENELDDCFAPDTFNGGCNYTPAHFSPIQCGQTIYGESGTFDDNRDMDWYRTTVNLPTSFTVTVEAEFDVQVLAFRQGPDPNDPCSGYRDVAAPVGPPPSGHNKCTPVVMATRCLPPGTYWFVVAPAASDGVACYSDYQVTLGCTACEPCQIQPCPSGAYMEGLPAGDPPPGYCVADPDDPTLDPENGGCNNVPPAFENLAYTYNVPFTVCGKLWANDGDRDLDWYGLDLTSSATVNWSVLSEVPCRATLLFWDFGGGQYGPPPIDCSDYFYWTDTLCTPCLQKTWDGTMFYQPGFYWFVVKPEDGSGPVFYGYPCPLGSADLGNDYQITMTVGWGGCCEGQILNKPHAYTEQPNDPPCPPGTYDDTYNSGCDHAPTGPTLPLLFDATNAWVSRSGTWQPRADNPTVVAKDYDWYSFTLTANRRFKVYLYSSFAATWEIWKQNDCAYGPIEGLAIPPCYDAGVFTVRCYTIGTYWLRVFPTSYWDCGKYYYLALTEAGSCSPCNFSCTGTDLDDPCDDVTDYDTNAGCDNPEGPPPHFMTFNCGATYCGRAYAAPISGVGHYDPDWFQITQTFTTNRRIRLVVTAEFLAHVEVYASCADYNAGTPIPGLDGITPLVVGTACPSMMLMSTGSFAPGTVVYGRITIVDQFGNLLTNYYPCTKGSNRWKLAASCPP